MPRIRTPRQISVIVTGFVVIATTSAFGQTVPPQSQTEPAPAPPAASGQLVTPPAPAGETVIPPQAAAPAPVPTPDACGNGCADGCSCGEGGCSCGPDCKGAGCTCGCNAGQKRAGYRSPFKRTTAFGGHSGRRGWFGGKANRHSGNGYGYGDCRNGDCRGGNCYGPGCRNGRGVGCKGPFGLCRKKGCATAGDTGWAPPAQMPIIRTPAQYRHWQSQAWYGSGQTGAVAYPMVYQPTDTTQLGFGYMQVPMWQRNRAMMPPAPNAGAYHSRFVPPTPIGGYPALWPRVVVPHH